MALGLRRAAGSSPMNDPRTLLIPGGSGYLGRALSRHFAEAGWRVVVLTRHPTDTGGPARQVAWDGRTRGDWTAELAGADAVVNLAGRSVNCRYTAANRRRILESRTASTRVLAEAVAACPKPPAVWLNSSSATIYRHATDRPMDEAGGEIGDGFSVDVCRQWEDAFLSPDLPRVRRVALRTAMAFGPCSGGVMRPFLGLARCGLGGTLGPGDQYVSWIHLDDFCRAVAFLIDADLAGPVNLAAPEPEPMRDWMRHVRAAVGTPLGIPAPAWLLGIGAFLMRTETELLLKSRRVVPGRLLDAGFRFGHPEPAAALREIVRSG